MGDIFRICSDFDTELATVLARLPAGWQVCYLGHHTAVPGDCHLLPVGRHVEGPCKMAADDDAWLPGLYCYLISRAGAENALQEALPLQSQIDIDFGSVAMQSGMCYVLE